MAKYFPTIQSTLENYLQWRVAQQWLGRPSEIDLPKLLVNIGWIPAAGSNIPLALFHRVGNDAPAVLRKALESNSVATVRSVRGARFLVERPMIPYAIAASRSTLERRWRSAWRAAGHDENKRTAWVEAVLDALGDTSLSTEELGRKLPAELTIAVPAPIAKKVGGSPTFLAWLLVELEEAGSVHEADGTFARYETRFPNLRKPSDIEPQEALLKMAERYFAWGNAATPQDFGWWMGMPPRMAELLMLSGDLPLSNVVVSGANTRGLMMHSRLTESLRLVKTEREGPVYALPSRDPMFAHNPFLIARTFDEKQQHAAAPAEGHLRPLVVENGRPVAAWKWVETKAEWSPLVRLSPALRKRIVAVLDRMSAWMLEHGVGNDPFRDVI